VTALSPKLFALAVNAYALVLLVRLFVPPRE
jgi:hypothetical protein